MLDFLAAGAGGAPGWTGFLPIIGMVAIFWFLIIRPQMRKQKEHQAKVAGIKKGDQVVTAGGLIGKVTKVDDQKAEVEVELAPNVKVRVVRSTISQVVSKTEPVEA
jgi:preprotein translocase subunit YajC